MYVWGDHRRFFSYTAYIRGIFGGRVQKLTLNTGLGCPHRDPKTGLGGCTYCRNEAFSPSYCQPAKDITTQLNEGIAFHRARYRRATRYLAYFQAYTNTFAPVDELRRLFRSALAHDDVVGLVVGTRPDCLPEPVVRLLQDLAHEVEVFVELGAESMHDATLRRVHRGHDARATFRGVERLQAAGLRVGLHLIFGLPGEDLRMMMDSLETVSGLGVQSLKFHQLQILEGTQMHREYVHSPGEFPLFGLEEYLDFLCQAIVRVPGTVAVERICAESPPRFLVAPSWGPLRNDQILARFERELEVRDLWQGKERGVPPA